jgi:hypothetical protein
MGKPKTPRTRVRNWLTALLLTALTVAALLGAIRLLLVSLSPWLEQQVQQRARLRGVELSAGHVSVDGLSLRLGERNFSLEGVSGVQGRTSDIRVRLQRDGFGVRVVRLEPEGLDLTLLGAPTTLREQLSAWQLRHPSPTDAPQISWPPAAVSWRAAPDSLLVQLRSLTWQQDADSVSASASVTIGDTAIGPTAARHLFAEDRTLIRLSDHSGSTRLDLQYLGQTTPPRLEVSLPRRPLSDFVPSLVGVTELGRSQLQATMSLQVLTATIPPVLQGPVRATLTGWLPPHPPELDGFLTGDRTELEAELLLAPGATSVQLHGLRLMVGDFTLQGRAIAQPEGDHWHAQAELSGAIACHTLVAAAAQSRVTPALRQWAAGAAKKAIAGSVTVTIRLDADSSHLQDAKLQRKLGVGCGLKPLDLQDVVDIALPLLDTLPTAEQLLSGLTTPAGKPATGNNPRPGSLGGLPPLPQIEVNKNGVVITLPKGLPRPGLPPPVTNDKP